MFGRSRSLHGAPGGRRLTCLSAQGPVQADVLARRLRRGTTVLANSAAASKASGAGSGTLTSGVALQSPCVAGVQAFGLTLLQYTHQRSPVPKLPMLPLVM